MIEESSIGVIKGETRILDYGSCNDHTGVMEGHGVFGLRWRKYWKKIWKLPQERSSGL